MLNSKMTDNGTERGFPKLMKLVDGDFVALFSSPTEGMIVYAGTSYYTAGHYSETWQPSCFQDFHGTITLEG